MLPVATASGFYAFGVLFWVVVAVGIYLIVRGRSRGTCSHCGESVAKEAQVCKHCGARFVTS